MVSDHQFYFLVYTEDEVMEELRKKLDYLLKNSNSDSDIVEAIKRDHRLPLLVQRHIY